MSKLIGIACAAFALLIIAMGWGHIWANPAASTSLGRLGWGYLVMTLGLLSAVIYRVFVRTRAGARAVAR